MGPKCSPKSALEASKRPLGAESGFRELFGVILDPPKSSKMELEFIQNVKRPFGCIFLAVWRTLGIVWGSILGSFWAPFWAPGRVMPFLQKIAPRHSESMIFTGSGGPKMRPKWIPNAPHRVPWRSPSDHRAPKAVLACFLGSSSTPQNRPKWS